MTELIITTCPLLPKSLRRRLTITRKKARSAKLAPIQHCSGSHARVEHGCDPLEDHTRLRNLAGAHVGLQFPGRTLIPRYLAHPCEGLARDINEAPASQEPAMILANLHDLVANSPTDLPEFDSLVGIKPSDVPSIDGRVVPAKGGAILVPRFSWCLASAKPPRRIDPDVLNGLSLKHPIEMHFAFRAPVRSVQSVHIDIEAPGANKLAIEMQLRSQSLIGLCCMKSFQHWGVSFSHLRRTPVSGRDGAFVSLVLFTSLWLTHR